MGLLTATLLLLLLLLSLHLLLHLQHLLLLLSLRTTNLPVSCVVLLRVVRVEARLLCGGLLRLVQLLLGLLWLLELVVVRSNIIRLLELLLLLLLLLLGGLL